MSKLFDKLFPTYGRIKPTKFTYDEFEAVSHYFRNTVNKDEYFVDDITWNDLDMDEVFALINNTNSSIGREYLYKILRTPTSDASVLSERDRLMEYMDSHPKERTLLMMQFHSIGFTKKISMSDYIDRLFELKSESNAVHFIMIGLLVLSILFTIFVNPVIGIMLILVAVGTCIISYYKYKMRIDSFFSCVRQIVAMTGAAKQIAKLNIPELSEYNEFFSEASRNFGKITRGSWMIVNSRDISGNLSDIILEYFKIFTHIDLIRFNIILRQLGDNKDKVYMLMEKLGLLEAMISCASFRKVIPYYCKPDFNADSGIDVKNMYHLLIEKPVANSISTGKSVLITGSNASGKSTFLKSTAIGAILAQSINTVMADSYKAPFYRIYTSMALNDSIESGESYYIVEIKSLKRILDASQKEGPKVLCFIDEVLRGTNTVERIAASYEILCKFSEYAVCFAATHDIELTNMLENVFDNYHFTEEVIGDNIEFSYVIMPGRATSRNAIKLLDMMGYDKMIVERAQKRAQAFVDTGVWESEKA